MYVSKRVYRNASGPGYSFSFKKEEQPYFFDKYHYHPEYEFIFIERGEGIMLIGDHIEAFQSGDLIFLGSNLSHMWKCDQYFYENNNHSACSSYVLHIPKEIIEHVILNIPEMEHIQKLIEDSKRGVKVTGDLKAQLIALFKKLPSQNRSERFISLMEMLNLLASSLSEVQLLSNTYFSAREEDASERLSIIYNYLLENMNEKISLQQIASISNMAPTAFCRFFKQKTNKSFTNLLNEIRINHARRLLIEGNKKIAQVALESGFINLSHFNKQFKIITGKTPKEYLVK